MGIFSKAKDAALTQAILKIAAPKLERYGELCQFNLDSAKRTFSVEALLKGEGEPVVLEGVYRIEERDGQVFVVLREIRISREWAQRLLDDHMPEIRLKAPEFVGSLL
jgi:hypothetical protein